MAGSTEVALQQRSQCPQHLPHAAWVPFERDPGGTHPPVPGPLQPPGEAGSGFTPLLPAPGGPQGSTEELRARSLPRLDAAG